MDLELTILHCIFQITNPSEQQKTNLRVSVVNGFSINKYIRILHINISKQAACKLHVALHLKTFKYGPEGGTLQHPTPTPSALSRTLYPPPFKP